MTPGRRARFSDLWRIIRRPSLDISPHVIEVPLKTFVVWIAQSNRALLNPLVRLLAGVSNLPWLLDYVLEDRLMESDTFLVLENWVAIQTWADSAPRCLQSICSSKMRIVFPALIRNEMLKFANFLHITEGSTQEVLRPWFHTMLHAASADVIIQVLLEVYKEEIPFQPSDDDAHRLLRIINHDSLTLPSEMRFAALAALHVMFGTDNFLQELSCCKDSYVHVFWITLCHLNRNQWANRMQSFFEDPNASPQLRFLSAICIMLSQRPILRSTLEQIPTYPMPWSGIIPLPPLLRAEILAEWCCTTAYRTGNDLRLVIEGSLAADELPSKEPFKYSRFAKYYEQVDLHIWGPFSSSKIYYGYGNFYVYTTFFKHQDEVKTLALLVTESRHFGRLKVAKYTEKKIWKQFLKKNPDVAFPDEATAKERLARWAQDIMHLSVLSKDFLSQTFDGIRMYTANNATPLKQLVFWTAS
jgi:hypothetical protein